LDLSFVFLTRLDIPEKFSPMHIVANARLYVTALMALVQASSSNSSLLGAIITLFLKK
jgi:hypothetical protein